MSEKQRKRKKAPTMAATIPPTTPKRKQNSSEKAKQHIEEIRKQKFLIGENRPNPLTKDLHHAVSNLSAELYSKDLHFLMELIQNAEDNKYLSGVEPTLEFVMTTEDITGSGVQATLLVFNNEVGFSAKNVESICSVGRSTKKGLRHKGFIGEKGIGFKSVFLVSGQPCIISNGYQVRFNERPNEDCGVGYVVPEWIEDKPSVSDIQQIYGTGKVLPATTIILPLKPNKLAAVRKLLSEVHPEVLLFLSKIKRLSVRENNGESHVMDSVSNIAISSKTNCIFSRSQGVDSRIVHLSVKEADVHEIMCCYCIWKQVFPVNPENESDGRKNIKKTEVSLAFPSGERFRRGASAVGIFAFLPTAMVTNFPFIVQADFILASSRETILLDNKWNLGILDSVPCTFVNALTCFMKSGEMISWFSTAQVLEFLPTRESPCKELEMLRQSIRTMVQAECILPCESFSTEKEIFCQPAKAIRILPEFRKILFQVKEQGAPLNGITSLGKFVCLTSLDCKEYNDSLDFIGVPSVAKNYAWYGKCIQACNFISQVSMDVYMELLCFFADSRGIIPSRQFQSAPLLKYVSLNEEVMSCSISKIKRDALKVHLVLEVKKHAWINKWNVEMGCPNNFFFLPNATVAALGRHERHIFLRQWLVEMGVIVTSVPQYCLALANFVADDKDPKLAVSLAYFVYESKLKHYLGMYEVFDIYHRMPIVDRSGEVQTWRTQILVPASGSKWVKLFGSDNPYAGQPAKVKSELGEADCLDKYVELGEMYHEATNFAESAREKNFLDFLANYTGALDLPDIRPLNIALQAASSQLTCDQAMLLLDWIRIMRTNGYEIPSRFIESIRNGRWLKVCSGFSSPTKCFLCNRKEESILLEMGKIHQLFSVVDQEFYLDRIESFKDELKLIGVGIGLEHMCQLIIDILKLGASSTKGREWAIFLLNFVRHSKVNNMLNENFLETVKEEKWLKTNVGYNIPVGSIFLTSDAEAVLQITSVPVIDHSFYEGRIDCFTNELKLLGAVVDHGGVVSSICNNFQFPKDLSSLNKDSIFFILDCIRLGVAKVGLTQKLSNRSWMKTTSGFRCPSECLLPSHKWSLLLKAVPLPIIDEAYYGNKLKLYKAELKAIGVAVDLDGVFKMLSDQFKFSLLSSSLTGTHVISTLNCMKCMGKKKPSQLFELRSCLMGEKWLKTSHGYKYASDSVLLDSIWETVVRFVDLPLVDEAYYGTEIYSYKDQLKMLGVVVDFGEGAHFVARGLCLPKEPAFVTADSALSLLQCVRSLRMNSSGLFLLKNLVDKLRVSKWLKTHMGYRSPEETLLFDPDWDGYLERHDAPFIDQSFYENFPSLEKEDLKAVGVKVDTEEVCTLISQILSTHTQTCVIKRIYKFLYRFNWIPRLLVGSNPGIWIPGQCDHSGGTWVNFQACVLHNRDNIFCSHLYALDKYYEDELLPFLRMAFGVAEVPCLDDYVKLWNDWVSTRHEVTQAECSSFWKYIAEHWNSVTEVILRENITMLPATTVSGGGVQLMEKEEIFIPDDLHLRKLFKEVSLRPLFTWYPPDDLLSLSLTKLSEIYCCLGVRKLSKSVKFNPSCSLSLDYKFEVVDSKNGLIQKGLIKIVLGFLASPQINMPVEERHKTASTLLEISLVLTDEPIEISYCLEIPSLDKYLYAKTRRMVLWDKNSNMLIVHNSGWNGGRNNIEFVVDFARAVSEGFLQSRTDYVDSLCKVVQMGFAYGFKEDAVDFLLMTENLELSVADTDFLSVAFPAHGEMSSLNLS